MKSVEAIIAEYQPPVKPHFFAEHTIAELQQLSSMEADKLGRLSFPAILRAGSSHYERIGWDETYDLVEESFRKEPTRVASYSSGRSSNEAAYLPSVDDAIARLQPSSRLLRPLPAAFYNRAQLNLWLGHFNG